MKELKIMNTNKMELNLNEMENTLDQLLEVFEHDKRTKLYEKTLFVYNTINKALETL